TRGPVLQLPVVVAEDLDRDRADPGLGHLLACLLQTRFTHGNDRTGVLPPTSPSPRRTRRPGGFAYIAAPFRAEPPGRWRQGAAPPARAADSPRCDPLGGERG